MRKALFFGLFLWLSQRAGATPIVLSNNFPANEFESPAIGDGYILADDFRSGAVPLLLSPLDLPIDTVTGNPENTLRVELYSDSSGHPGSPIVSLLPDAPIGTFGIDTTGTLFSPSMPTVLAADTNYWVVASQIATGTEIVWQGAGGTGTGIGYLGGSEFSTDEGLTWSPGELSAMIIEADAVPELQWTGSVGCLSLFMITALLLESTRKITSP